MNIHDVIEFLTSSSSDEEILNVINHTNKKKISKIGGFIDVIHTWSDQEFKRNFRMDRSTANLVIDKYIKSPFSTKQNDHGLKHICSETEILCFIWFTANKCCLRDVSQRFGIGISTQYRTNLRVTEFLVSIAPDIIYFQKTLNAKEKESLKFQKLKGFPGVIGCVDGTSIPIATPAHKLKHTYVNRHDIPCITVQAICDHQKRFVDVFIGAPGKIHDARVWKLSDISKNISEICGNHFHILGDSAYPIRKWLLTPFKDFGNLGQQQKNYNKKHCGTRVIIENAFGLLKGRFRQLQKIEMQKVEKISKFIIACCVLHNICIDNTDLLPKNEYGNTYDNHVNIIDDTEIHLKIEEERKRNYIKTSIY